MSDNTNESRVLKRRRGLSCHEGGERNLTNKREAACERTWRSAMAREHLIIVFAGSLAEIHFHLSGQSDAYFIKLKNEPNELRVCLSISLDPNI